MDIIQIATSALTLVTPYLIEGGKELTKGMGKDLWSGIKNLFTSENEKQVLTNLQEKPNDSKVQEEVKNVLIQKLGQSEESLKKINELINELKEVQINKSHNTITSSDGDNIIIQGTNVSGHIKIKK